MSIIYLLYTDIYGYTFMNYLYIYQFSVFLISVLSRKYLKHLNVIERITED